MVLILPGYGSWTLSISFGMNQTILMAILLLFKFFPTNLNRWFFTGVWVTANLHMSPGLFLSILEDLTVLWSRWSRFFFWSPVPSISFPGLWELFQVHKLLSVSPSSSCSTSLSVTWQDLSISLSFCFL